FFWSRRRLTRCSRDWSSDVCSSDLYARNERFWEIGRPRIEAVHVEAIADDSRRATAIAAGTIDLVPNVPLLDIPMLRDEPTVYLDRQRVVWGVGWCDGGCGHDMDYT